MYKYHELIKYPTKEFMQDTIDSISVLKFEGLQKEKKSINK